MTSLWARWRLKSPASPLLAHLLVRAQIKENIKAPRHWPLCREFTGVRWAQKANNAENVSIGWRHHVPTGLGYTRCPSKMHLKLHIREISFFWNCALNTNKLRNLGLKSVSYDRRPSTVRRRLDIDPTVSDICLIDVDSRPFIIWGWCINHYIAPRTMDVTPKYRTNQNQIVGTIHDL